MATEREDPNKRPNQGGQGEEPGRSETGSETETETPGQEESESETSESSEDVGE